ncbi:hypothetical protein [uncultured Flavobacterium sp.]|uniref:hypothetical protein n=1 Tax=uncultured Flavobacterium sp. TaxID=165435 RepID=UPI0025F7AD01|nr:hypothetical protein [uncultured Flavobacterium sp.]
MTPADETKIDAHILKSKENAYITLWSVLNKDKAYYNASIKDLLRDGYLHCSFTSSDDIVGFTRILNHIGLEFEYVTKGIELKENAKKHYRDTRMCPKMTIITFAQEKKYNRVGKDEPDDNKLGWCDRKFKE